MSADCPNDMRLDVSIGHHVGQMAAHPGVSHSTSVATHGSALCGLQGSVVGVAFGFGTAYLMKCPQTMYPQSDPLQSYSDGGGGEEPGQGSSTCRLPLPLSFP